MLLNMQIQGYRVISVDIPRVWNYHEWIQAFEKFLDTIDVHHVRSLKSFKSPSMSLIFTGAERFSSASESS